MDLITNCLRKPVVCGKTMLQCFASCPCFSLIPPMTWPSYRGPYPHLLSSMMLLSTVSFHFHWNHYARDSSKAYTSQENISYYRRRETDLLSRALLWSHTGAMACFSAEWLYSSESDINTLYKYVGASLQRSFTRLSISWSQHVTLWYCPWLTEASCLADDLLV